MVKKMMLLLVAIVLVAAPVFANCGHCGSGEGAQCPMAKSGDAADTIKQAAAALHESNHELAEKLEAIAKHCCEKGLHDKAE